jgi:hypothetical protein
MQQSETKWGRHRPMPFSCVIVAKQIINNIAYLGMKIHFEKYHLLGYNAVQSVECQPTESSACHLLPRWFLSQPIFSTPKM